MATSSEIIAGRPRFAARAWCLGDRIETRLIKVAEPLANAPLTLRTGSAGAAVVFRYGAAVLFDLTPDEEAAFLEELRPALVGPFPTPGTENAEICISPAESSQVVSEDGSICLARADLAALQNVAHVLAKSAVLDHYEEHIAGLFERIEAQADALSTAGRIPNRGKDLLRQIGDVLKAQTRSVARVEVTEKPEMTWEDPELDRIYVRLSLEYELRSRDLALARKMELIWDTAQTLFEVLQNRRSLRVEWYITILIVFETALVGWDLIR